MPVPELELALTVSLHRRGRGRGRERLPILTTNLGPFNAPGASHSLGPCTATRGASPVRLLAAVTATFRIPRTSLL